LGEEIAWPGMPFQAGREEHWFTSLRLLSRFIHTINFLLYKLEFIVQVPFLQNLNV
jgi:hypothetical protein